MIANFCTSSYGWTKLDKKKIIHQKKHYIPRFACGWISSKRLHTRGWKYYVGVGSPKAVSQYSNTIDTGILSTTSRACLLLNSAFMMILREYIEQCFTLDKGLVIISFAWAMFHIRQRISDNFFCITDKDWQNGQNELLLQMQGNQSIHPWDLCPQLYGLKGMDIY